MNKVSIIILTAVLVILTVFLIVALNYPGILMLDRVRTEGDENGNTLEVLSWWTAGGEADGLQELYRLYQEKYPDVEIVNSTVVGGAGANAHLILPTRMKGNSPPDSFQVHAGPELLQLWIKPDLLEPLTYIYSENGWLDKFSASILNKITYEGEIYAIPLNIHRGNIVWYNTAFFSRYNIGIPKSHEEFIEVMEELAGRGITPLALGDKNIWPAMRLMENILIQEFKADGYKGLWSGASRWDTDKMRSVLNKFIELIRYTNSDHAALTWDESVQYVVDGKSAMVIMGDFAEGYFLAEGLVLDADFSWFVYPGTEGIFSVFSDTFVVPRGATHKENALRWAELLGSIEGQDAFNPIKGSISPRLDSNLDFYDDYLKAAHHDYSSDIIVPSFLHGAAINAAWEDEITEITEQFVISGDIEKTLTDLQNTAEKHLSGDQ